jgi:hypothetical protein
MPTELAGDLRQGQLGVAQAEERAAFLEVKWR